MRVLSEWTQQNLRVTVMHMNDKYVLKLEDGLLEQTYKFRDGQIKDVNHLRSLIDSTFVEASQKGFENMKNSQFTMLKPDVQTDQGSKPESDFNFPEII